ncbi:hypothetical protein LshimejAT787_1102420 [Lyophyllum shimeji]|uniref:Uncharacterized protein n=1 Tax=Lyophyllum shimeji TaxID=47721 RepID=A0A9P3PVW6_LYOSH|nr:hypothetical protein LshimejAT787_1102420 [Lyophyllum shimeji]
MSSASALFTPLKVGSITVRNRVAMSALTRNRVLNTRAYSLHAKELTKEYMFTRSCGMSVAPPILMRPSRDWLARPCQPNHVTPTAVEDPWTIIAQFKQAAINAKEAGFDGVERKLLRMPLEETLATYSYYFLNEADKLGLAYIALVRYVAATDVNLTARNARR